MPITLLAPPSRWSTHVKIAASYRVGNIFLAGDAAHQWPPWGGFGGNAGIADVHNLAWKLAATLSNTASQPHLLDSYETERRPIAVVCGQQALVRRDFEARFSIPNETNKDDIAQQLDMADVLLRYRYPVGQAGEKLEPAVKQLRAQTGTRFPHASIRREEGEEMTSTLDLFGKKATYTLLLGPSAAAGEWRDRQSQPNTAVYMVGRDFEISAEGVDWASLTELADDGAVLVRPDGFVAGRSDETFKPAVDEC